MYIYIYIHHFMLNFLKARSAMPEVNACRIAGTMKPKTCGRSWWNMWLGTGNQYCFCWGLPCKIDTTIMISPWFGFFCHEKQRARRHNMAQRDEPFRGFRLLLFPWFFIQPHPPKKTQQTSHVRVKFRARSNVERLRLAVRWNSSWRFFRRSAAWRFFQRCFPYNRELRLSVASNKDYGWLLWRFNGCDGRNLNCYLQQRLDLWHSGSSSFQE